MSTAALHVTKLAAAKRQIQAAIRLFFLEEDELAIHTVASAAYGLLKDLKRDRGQSEAADIYRTAFFYVVRDFRRGTLPAHFTSDPSIMAEVERIADQLFFITADSKLPDVKLTIPQDVEKQYWNDNNRAANFLKHADRDTDGTLSLAACRTFRKDTSDGKTYSCNSQTIPAALQNMPLADFQTIFAETSRSEHD